MWVRVSLQSILDCFRVLLDNPQEYPSRSIRSSASLFPVLNRTRIQPKALCKSHTAEAHRLTKRTNIDIGHVNRMR